jgi:hypothetical protein
MIPFMRPPVLVLVSSLCLLAFRPTGCDNQDAGKTVEKVNIHIRGQGTVDVKNTIGETITSFVCATNPPLQCAGEPFNAKSGGTLVLTPAPGWLVGGIRIQTTATDAPVPESVFPGPDGPTVDWVGDGNTEDIFVDFVPTGVSSNCNVPPNLEGRFLTQQGAIRKNGGNTYLLDAKFLPVAAFATNGNAIVEFGFHEGAGNFTGTDVHTGTFEITEDEAQYETCGVCIRVFATGTAATASFGTPIDDGYLATAGTVELGSITGDLTGVVAGTYLQHVEIDGSFHSTPHPDGCMSYIPYLEFDGPIVDQ